MQRRTIRLCPTDPANSLDLIRRGQGDDAGDVRETTGLSRMTVSQRLDALLAAGMVVDGEMGEATGGRRRRVLVLNHAHSRAPRLRSTPPTPGSRATDLGGQALADTEIDVPVATGPSTVLDQIAAASSALLDKCELSPADLCGAGLSLPGPVDPASGTSKFPAGDASPRGRAPASTSLVSPVLTVNDAVGVVDG